MRFSLRDCAVAIFIVSLYLATATAMGGVQTAWIGAGLTLVAVGVGSLFDAALGATKKLFMGQVLLRLRSDRPSYALHLLIALVANGIGAACLAFGDPVLAAFAAYAMTSAVLLHLAALFGGRDTLVSGDSLVSVGANLCSWKRCRFRLS